MLPKLSQETLAEMVGTTRSRVNFFMNKFRKLGLIEYNGGLKVNSSLLSIVLHKSRGQLGGVRIAGAGGEMVSPAGGPDRPRARGGQMGGAWVFPSKPAPFGLGGTAGGH